MKRYLTAFLICLLVGPYAQAAENKIFTSDWTIDSSQGWNMVGIYDTPPAHTTVNMTGGTVYSVSAWNASTFNFLGGNVTQTVSATQQSVVNISASGVSYAVADTGATLNISGGANLSNVSASGSSMLNVYGGTMSILDIQGATANLYGGSVTSSLWAHAYSTVNVFGTGLAKTSTGGTFGDGQVTGFWLNGPAFTINMENPETYSHINLVPEPATLILLGLGGLSLRLRRA